MYNERANCSRGKDSGRTIVRLLLYAGIGLIVLAVVLFGNNFYQQYLTEEQCRDILKELTLIMPEQAADVSGVWQETGEDPAVLEVCGVSCIGMLEAPFLDQAWPVASRFEQKVHIPCVAGREKVTEAIIIEDTKSGNCFDCFTPGDEGKTVRFTDVWGYMYTYVITDVLKGSNNVAAGADLIISTRDQFTGETVNICCRQE